MNAKKSKNGNIVWMDLEMTGLDPAVDEIIEIATLITDSELNIIAEGPEIIVHQPESRFEKMDDWNQRQHTSSGLWQKVVESEITIDEAEKTTFEFIKEHINEGKSPLAGNSIYQDRRFLRKYMKNIEGYLHYRIIDVSTVKELAGRWYSKKKVDFKKPDSHRAMDDIRASIDELKFYREQIFVDAK